VRKNLTTDIKKSAKKNVSVKFRSVIPEEGDNINNQFLIVFDNPIYSSPQEEQTAILGALFGTEHDSVAYITHDAELLKASEKARSRLPELKSRFNSGLEPGFSILVKVPFKTDSDGREWMWVEITKWKGQHITGILQNDPAEISKLKAGAIVSAEEKDVFDYILNKADGTYEGNETGKIIEKEK
jgi:uncharacterized protein YegJ (DUF2314 family)